MSKNFTMSSEVSSVRIGEEEEDEIELSLGLSIGGSFRKTEKSKPINQNPINSCVDTDLSSEYVNPQKREMATNGDFIWLEGQRLRNRVRDREMRENEDTITENTYRKCKNEIYMRDLNLTLNHKVAVDPNNQNSNPIASSSSPPVLMVPAVNSCPALKFVPFTIGFGYHPNVMPGWDPNSGSFGGDMNVIRPVVCRSFQPYHVNQNSGHGVFKNCDYEYNGNGNAVSNGSPVRCLSAVSDHRSKSQQGGSNSDSGSHWCPSQPEHHQQNASAASDPEEQSEHSSYSSQIEPTQVIEKTSNFPEKMVSPNTTQPGGINSGNPIAGPLKRDNGDLGKPPKPQTGNQDSASMSQMPCVSTTGYGPNGKTITGFLYRYTKTEVSIICVCHGSSFSPAEFVKHAGGKDVSHPLRHITVIPSAFE